MTSSNSSQLDLKYFGIKMHGEIVQVRFDEFYSISFEFLSIIPFKSNCSEFLIFMHWNETKNCVLCFLLNRVNVKYSDNSNGIIFFPKVDFLTWKILCYFHFEIHRPFIKCNKILITILLLSENGKYYENFYFCHKCLSFASYEQYIAIRIKGT